MKANKGSDRANEKSVGEIEIDSDALRKRNRPGDWHRARRIDQEQDEHIRTLRSIPSRPDDYYLGDIVGNILGHVKIKRR